MSRAWQYGFVFYSLFAETRLVRPQNVFYDRSQNVKVPDFSCHAIIAKYILGNKKVLLILILEVFCYAEKNHIIDNIISLTVLF